MNLIVITPLKMRANGSLMRILLLITLCLEDVSVNVKSLYFLLSISKIARMHIRTMKGHPHYPFL